MGQFRNWIAATLALAGAQAGLQAQSLPLRTICSLPGSLSETSGIIRTAPDRIWSHNDSGGDPKLYQVDTSGTLLRTVVLRDTPNLDWEEITQDAAGNVYLGDFGNNANDRTNLVILRLPPLDSSGADTLTPDRIEFSYSDQAAFPPHDTLKNFDMEAMVAWGDSLYLFSKNRTVPFDGWTKCYVLPQAPGTHVAALRDSFYTGTGTMLTNWISAAALNAAGDQLVLLSYAKIWVFSCFEGTDFFGGAVVQRGLPFGQMEAAAWADDGHLLVTDEVLNGVGGKLYDLDLGIFQLAPSADLGPDTAYFGNGLWLAAPANPGGSYLWSTGETSYAIEVSQSGAYWLEVQAANGCIARDTILVDIFAAAQPAAGAPSIGPAVGPNPFGAGGLRMRWPQAVPRAATWTLVAANGSIAAEGRLDATWAGEAVIAEGNALQPGFYALQVRTAAGQWSWRLLRQ